MTTLPIRNDEPNGDPTDAVVAMPSWYSTDTRDRQRTMLHSRPIQKGAHGQTMVIDDLRHYDFEALALRIFELTLDGDGLVDQVTTESLTASLSPMLQSMDAAATVPLEPSDMDARHARMVERVLDTLRNEAERREEFIETMYDPSLPDARREVRFRLLEDRHHPGGGVTIRPTAESVNLYLRQLDMDLASQQDAAEAAVAYQLRRGHLEAAESRARDARRASSRYREWLTLELERTNRDVTLVDWGTAIPAQLDAAHTHLNDRIGQERVLLDGTDARMKELTPGSANAQTLGRIKRLILDARTDHQKLLNTLIGARQTFLQAQARQRFQPTISRSVPDPTTEMLGGALQRTPRELGDALSRLVSAMLPPVPPPVWTAGDQLAWSLSDSKRSASGPGGLRQDVDLIDLPPDALAFPPDVRAAGERWIARATETRTPLSHLLRAIYRDDDLRLAATAHYVALRSLWALDHEQPSEETEVRPTGLTPLVARSLDTRYTVGPFCGIDIALYASIDAADRPTPTNDTANTPTGRSATIAPEANPMRLPAAHDRGREQPSRGRRGGGRRPMPSPRNEGAPLTPAHR